MLIQKQCNFVFQDLIKDLESELSGDFRETIMAMFRPTTFYDAWSLHEAVKVNSKNYF